MIRLAFIGLGAVAHNIHLPACRLLGDRVHVVAGSDPDAVARTRAATRWKIPALFESPAEMLASVAADWVIVGTPPALHRAHTELALAAGCHVFCEKPFAESLSDADAMIHAASVARRQLVINNQFPYMASHHAARAEIGGPRFGRLLFLHAWHTMQPSAHSEAGWRGVLVRRLGFEFGIHVMDLVRFFFGEDPVRLYATIPRAELRAHNDQANLVTLEFADGRGASIVLNRLTKGPERYLDMRLEGEYAAIETSIGGRAEMAVGVHAASRRPFARLEVAGGAQATLRSGRRTIVLARDGLNLFAASTARHLGNVLDAVAEGREPPASARDNRRSLALVLASYDSAAAGMPIDLAPYLADAR